MNNTVNFDGIAANDVECKIGFYNKDTITRTFEFIIFWGPSKERLCRKAADLLVEFFDERGGIGWAVICDPVKD